MADIKDTVASHISTNWNAAVLGGSGSVPTVDAVGPEDILKPQDYPEAVLVYNERVSYDRIYSQGSYGDRHTRVYLLLTAHTKSGCTKVHFRAFIDELKSVFGSAISGFDLQILDPEENVTKTTGVAGGMYQASFVLHLFEYGVSTSSAASGGAAGATYWSQPFVTYSASSDLTAERLLTLTGNNILGADLAPSTDDTYDLGSSTKKWAEIHCDELYATKLSGDMVPSADSTHDLGAASNEFAEVHTDSIKSSGGITIQPSGDTDDYFTMTTAGGVPIFTRVGGYQMYWSSDDANHVAHLIYRDGNAFLKYDVWDTTTYIDASDPIRVRPSGDLDDYLYFITTSNIAYLLPVEDKVHYLGSASLSYDHVYADDFDNTSPFELIEKPLDALKAITSKKTLEKVFSKDEYREVDALDYASLPDFVRTHIRDPSKNIIEEYHDPDNKEAPLQQRVIERAPKDIIADEGFSVNRMCILLYQAVQELTAKVEALEALQQTPK